MTSQERDQELRRIANGDRRPVIEQELPVGHPDNGYNAPLVTQQVDQARLARLQALQRDGLIHPQPFRWYPASYGLTPAGQLLIDTVPLSD